MANKKASQEILEFELEEDYTIEELGDQLEALDWLRQMQEADFEFLEEEKKKIANPVSLGKVIKDEVWKQLTNQVGLELTDQSLVREYDKTHNDPEEYDKKLGHDIRGEKRYRDAAKDMKEAQKAGTLLDAYTGEKLDKDFDVDHVQPAKLTNDVYFDRGSDDNPNMPAIRRVQAGISDPADLANIPENLVATDQSINRSKKAKSNTEYVRGMSEREDTPAADPELMLAAEKKADTAQKKLVYLGAAKNIGKEVRSNVTNRAKTQIIMDLLKNLLEEVIKGMVRFFKATAKSLKKFLSEMMESIKRFFNKVIKTISKSVKGTLWASVNEAIGTILAEIWKPLASTFKFIKQGVTTVTDAVRYFMGASEKNIPFSVKLMKVGEIVIGGLTAAGAIIGGEFIATALKMVPGMQIPLPGVGSLANVIGFFLSSIISGIIGAMIINRIEKMIADKERDAIKGKQKAIKNQIILTETVVVEIQKKKTKKTQERAEGNIKKRHKEAAEMIKGSLAEIVNGNNNRKYKNTKREKRINDDFEEMERLLKDIEGEKC